MRLPLTVSCTNGVDTRAASVSVNGQDLGTHASPNTGGWDNPSTKVIAVKLLAGANTIAFSDPDTYGPNSDKLSISVASIGGSA